MKLAKEIAVALHTDSPRKAMKLTKAQREKLEQLASLEFGGCIPISSRTMQALLRRGFIKATKSHVSLGYYKVIVTEAGRNALKFAGAQ
jgi:hypothetical protein